LINKEESKMKKVLVCLFAAALMLLPMGAGAALQSVEDSDLAALTGQAGVDLAISAPQIALNLQSITWGDPDGFGTTYTAPGFINHAIPPIAMHVGVSDFTLSIDTGTNPAAGGETAVLLTVSANTTITLDAFMAAIYLDGANAVVADYLNADGLPAVSDYCAWDMATVLPTSNLSKCLGIVGISGLKVNLPQATTIQISAH
jgi:hypothetical protein